jgi:hypothetical protein
MFYKGVLTLLAVSVIGLAGITPASAGGGGNFPEAGYSFLSILSPPGRICHPVRQKVLTRYGWRLCRARSCG